MTVSSSATVLVKAEINGKHRNKEVYWQGFKTL